MAGDQRHLLRVVDSEILALWEETGLGDRTVAQVVAQLEAGSTDVIRLAPAVYDALWNLLLVRRSLMGARPP